MPAAILFMLLLAAGGAQATPLAPDDPLEMLGKSRTQMRVAPRESDDRGYDCIDLSLELSIDFQGERILGSAQHRIAATASIDAVIFDLTDSLLVSEVRQNGRMVAFTHQDRLLQITLDPSLNLGDLAELEIDYSGHPPREGMRGFAFDEHNGVPLAYTLSEPTTSSSWWPCKDVPDDKMLATVVLDIPDTLYAGSNGVLIADESDSGRRRMTWRESWPIAPYLISVVCTNYEIFEDIYVGIDGSELPLLYLAFPEDLQEARLSWQRTPEMIRVFEEHFGPYPFAREKYGMAEFTWGGAMENQTLTSYGAYAIDGTEAQNWLIAHELAHQWWGNMVTLDSWDHLWLNEGFARFSEALWLESQGGFDAYHEWILNMWRPSFPGPIVPPDHLFNQTVYLKGAWVLHMLRGVLGDEDFFAGLRLYADRYRYANANTDDLLHAFEDATDRDLEWFFDQWIYKKGRPMYAFGWEVEYNDAVPILDLRIEQQQEQPVFRMPIQMGIEDAQGRYIVVVEDSLRMQDFKIPARLPPIAVDLDPNDWILSNLVGTDAPEPSAVRLALGAPWPSPGPPPFWIPVAPAPHVPALDVFDVTGRLLRRLPNAGSGTILWDGRDEHGHNLPTGLYFLRARGEQGGPVRRIWIVR